MFPTCSAWSGACCSTWSSSWGLRLSSRLRRGAHAAPRRSRTAAGLRRGVAAGRTDGVEPLGVRRRPVHDLSREPSAIADEDRQRIEPTVMTETLLMLYTMFAAAGTFALLSLLGAVELRARRQRSPRRRSAREIPAYRDALPARGRRPRAAVSDDPPCRRPAAARRDRRRTCRRHLRTGRRAPAAHRRGVRTRRLAAPPHGPLPGYRRARCLLLLSRLPSAQPRRTAPRVMPRAATATCVSSR